MPPLPEPTARKNPSLADRIAAIVIERYLALPSSQRPQLRSNGVQEWTPLAGIVLVSPSGNETELVSLGAGSKVLPTGQRSASGDLVNDLHAEVIAIRGARRWLLEEVRRLLAVGNKTGRWLTQGRAGGKWRLLDGVSLHIYVSCLPCGDASMVHLAKMQEIENPAMATMKASSIPSDAMSREAAAAQDSVLARGRDGYLNLGAIRTKPGRADSPPTSSLSCSDKLASYTLLGIQGSILSELFEPIYLDGLIVGEIMGYIDTLGELEWEKVIVGEANRAICQRISLGMQDVAEDLPAAFQPHPLAINLTSIPFPYSKLELARTRSKELTSSPCIVSLVPPFKSERLAQAGTLHGPKPKRASPIAPLPDKLVSQLSRLSLFRLYAEVAGLMGQGTVSGGTTTYREVKDAAREYQRAKWLLRGRKGAAFRGWEGKGRSREAFGLDGVAKGANPGIDET